MSQYKRLPTKKEKSPDQFVSTVDHLLHALSPYRRLVLLTVIGIFIFGLGTLFIKNYHQRSLVRLSEEIYEAKSQEHALLIRNHPEMPAQLLRLKVIEKAIQDKDFDRAGNEINQALNLLPDFLKPVLSLSLTQLYWQKGELQKALNSVEEMSQSKDPIVGNVPLFIKAALLEEMGKLEEARQLYQALSKGAIENAQIKEWANQRLVWMDLQSS